MSEDELRAQARHAWLLAKTWPSEEEKIECIYLNLRAAVEAERAENERLRAALSLAEEYVAAVVSTAEMARAAIRRRTDNG